MLKIYYALCFIILLLIIIVSILLFKEKKLKTKPKFDLKIIRDEFREEAKKERIIRQQSRKKYRGK